jgi:DpnII restriction endonuclease.
MKEYPLYKKISCNSGKEVFNYLLSSLKDSIKGWDYFVNWEKALGNVREIEIDLNILNYLIGKENIIDEFKRLLIEYPRTYRLIPILIACRECDFNILNPKEGKIFNYEYYDFKKSSKLSIGDVNKAAEFANNSGILNLFKSKTIKNVVDYVFGVEVGLDSNGRKNRSGTSMENLIERFIKCLCEQYGFEYLIQATSSRINEKWGIHVTVDKSERRFDFAVNNNISLYLIETNYYGGGGSKLKATAGEYKSLFDLISKDNHKFIWTTDGQGWHTAARPLEETFNHIDYILNLDMIEKGLLEDIIIGNL